MELCLSVVCLQSLCLKSCLAVKPNNEATRFRAQMLLNQIRGVGEGGVANSQQRKVVCTSFLFTVVDDHYFNRQCSHGKRRDIGLLFFPCWRKWMFLSFLSHNKTNKVRRSCLKKASGFRLLSSCFRSHKQHSLKEVMLFNNGQWNVFARKRMQKCPTMRNACPLKRRRSFLQCKKNGNATPWWKDLHTCVCF